MSLHKFSNESPEIMLLGTPEGPRQSRDNTVPYSEGTKYGHNGV